MKTSGTTRATTLGLDPDELATCVACGLCLPHCPTFRVTGDESASPRGRIAAMRLVESGAPITAEFVTYMDLCIQCRGCEAACPSAVPFGRLMETTRHALAAQPAVGYRRWWHRVGFRMLGHARLLGALSLVLALAQRVRLVPTRLAVPRIPISRRRLTASGSDVWLFTGCVMDAWMRPVHEACKRVMEATGAGVRPSPPRAGCCGALAAHAGFTELARRQAETVVGALEGDAPVIVDSAGCGAYMKEYERVLGSKGEEFAKRVRDVHEWLAERDIPEPGHPLELRVAVQDPCHLRHVQRAHGAVRTVLRPFVGQLVEPADDGLCCGAGGAYSVMHPDMAAEVRTRKVAALGRLHADVVVSANPGCAMHLAAAGLDVRHPLELVARALSGGGADG